MKRKRFTEEQIIGILQEAEKGQKTIAEVCRTAGVSEPTFYVWRRRFGALSVPEVRRLRDLEKENGRLKKLVAERDLEIDALKELVEKK
jgi:putative transposase